MAKAGSGDTSQLARSSDGTVCMFRVRSFNVDIDQNMRTRKRCRQHGPKIEYILTTTVQDAGLQFVDLCELDSLRQRLLLGVPSVHVRLAESAADGDDSSTADDGANQPDVTGEHDIAAENTVALDPMSDIVPVRMMQALQGSIEALQAQAARIVKNEQTPTIAASE